MTNSDPAVVEASSTAVGPETFDLRDVDFSAAGGRTGILVARVMVGLLGCTAGITIAVIASQVFANPSAGPAIVLAILATGIVVCTIGFFGLGPGPVRCRVDSEGLTFQYKKGRSKVISWGDRNRVVKLVSVSTDSGVAYELKGWLPLHNYLTAEAFARILSELEQRGTGVQTRRTPGQLVTVTEYETRLKSST